MNSYSLNGHLIVTILQGEAYLRLHESRGGRTLLLVSMPRRCCELLVPATNSEYTDR